MNIRIEGARSHNLKNISLEIPRSRLVAVTGVSGSGKSTLVFDTIAAAAQREFFDSLSSYARRSLPRFPAPEIDSINYLSPCIVIDQRPVGHNSRSTVGTMTEAYTLLRLLYSRMGSPIVRAGDLSFNRPEGACEACGGLGVQMVPDLDRLIDFDKSLTGGAIRHRTWKVGSRYWNILKASGMFDMDRPVGTFDIETLQMLLYSEPRVLSNAAPGYVQSFSLEGVVRRLIKRQNDKRGLGSNDYDSGFFRVGPCEICNGSRINLRARSVLVEGRSITELVNMEFPELATHLETLKGSVAETIVPQIIRVLRYLIHSGVSYLTLGRSVNTLSGGESQRVKLSRQLGSALTEIIYVMDEPTIGLHPKDVDRLGDLLLELRSRPNTVLVVEHDRSIIERADHVIELGPSAGEGGGRVIGQGSPKLLAGLETPTGRMLGAHGASVQSRSVRRPSGYFDVTHARRHNLKDIEVHIPKGVLVCITGVSGSGKTSLVNVLLARHPEIVEVDQSPVGRSSRSIIATYVGAFDGIRDAFSAASGREPGIFAFNGTGACEVCAGLGQITMDMHFLGDVQMVCEKCNGKRYMSEVLRYRLRDKTIAEVLDLTVDEAADFFSEGEAEVRARLRLLSEVGLGYLRLGQPLNTLSGGELQRSKLANRLHKKGLAYCLDEPTRGLHYEDVQKLIRLLDRLVQGGNSVIIIEHDLSVISAADWVIDIGPGGGEAGGRIVAEGPPVEIAASPNSYTGYYLARALMIDRGQAEAPTK